MLSSLLHLRIYISVPVEGVVVVAEDVGVGGGILDSFIRNNGNVGCGDIRLKLFDVE